jgi:hypothetical protein
MGGNHDHQPAKEPLPLPVLLPNQPSNNQQSAGAPSIAHFAMGGNHDHQPAKEPLPLLLLSSYTEPKARHFDRSCSQPHREQRSGEIRFSTTTLPHPGARASSKNSMPFEVLNSLLVFLRLFPRGECSEILPPSRLRILMS